MEYISDLISLDEILNSEEDNIILDFQMGKGKNSFVLNNLAPAIPDRKILLLVNRSALYEQEEKDIRNSGSGNISISTYQKFIKNFDNYPGFYDDCEILVCDEAHYFFTDSSFNSETDITLQIILGMSCKKIFMSATCDILRDFFSKYDIPYKLFSDESNRDFSYLESVSFFKRNEDIYRILDNLPNQSKALVFLSTKKKCKELQDYYNRQNISTGFLCSRSDKNNFSENMKSTYDALINHNQFSEKILFTTIALDNGINIYDDNLNVLIIDIFDIDLIIQAIGRIRNRNNHLKVYIKEYTYKSVSYISKNAFEQVEFVKEFQEYGDLQFVNILGRILFDSMKIKTLYLYPNIESCKLEIKIKKSTQFYFKHVLDFCQKMLEDSNYYLLQLQNKLPKANIIPFEVNDNMDFIDDVLNLLDLYSEKDLFPQDIIDFKNKFNNILPDKFKRKIKGTYLPINRKDSIQNIISNKLNLFYKIESEKPSKGEYRNKTIWRIVKL